MRRRPLLIAVLAVLAMALAAALCATAPDHGLPAVALGSTLVWRVEIAAAVFGAGYGAVVTARLAFHGHTFTRVGSSGIDIPPVGQSATANRIARANDELTVLIADLSSAVETLDERVTAIEDPSQLGLRSQTEET